MSNTPNVYDYQNEVIGAKQVNAHEGFEPVTGDLFNSNILLKTILFSMLFYIVNSPVTGHILARNLRNIIDINLLQTLIFATGFYVMTLYL